MLNAVVLDKQWLVAPDPQNIGKLQGSGYADAIRPDALPVPVPGILQQTLPEYHGVVWYYYTLENPFAFVADRRFLLSFGAVDYYSDIYVGGKLLYSNEGAENPFEVDVTDAIRGQERVLIAIRIINPPEAYVIEGFERHKIPHRNIEADFFRAGACYNAGGITQPVTLRSVPLRRIADIFARCNIHTGELSLELTSDNQLESAAVRFEAEARLCGSTAPVVTASFTGDMPSGLHTAAFTFTVPEPRLWSCDDPALYDVTVRLFAGEQEEDSYTLTVGFREFRVEKGFFFLNGKRLYLKAAHTGNCFPGGVNIASLPGMELKDFQLAKAAGFNCIRFISTCATPAQLDYCDRLGMMVYEESYASWCLSDSPRVKELFHSSILAMVRRDRNHPCVTIWGMLNETGPKDQVFAVARDILPDLRRIDDTRLVIFNSGRFDLNNHYDNFTPDFSLGSFANPGEAAWQCEWGSEGKPECSEKIGGDVHGYMGTPLTAGSIARNRTMGIADGVSGPVFISETGVASQLDVISACRQFDQHNIPRCNPDHIIFRQIADAYERDFYRYGCDSAYANPEDFLYDSNRYNGETRRMCFDAIRSNPRFCGYNVTGLLDHCITGEGPFTLFREYKPTNYDAFADGFAPLRWCLFTSTGNLYRGDEIELEAVLANEDALRDGSYTAEFAVTDECGRAVWKHSEAFTLPILDREGYPAFAFPVMKQKIRLDVPAGKYYLKAYLKNGGAPRASIKEFLVSDRLIPLAEPKQIYLYAAENIRGFLENLGFQPETVTDLDQAGLPAGVRLLVGTLPDETALEDAKKLFALAASGVNVTFLEPLTFDDTKPAASALELPNKAVLGFPAWLYHKDIIIKPNPLTEGLPTGYGEWGVFDGCYPHIVVVSDRIPNDSAVVFFAVGNYEWVTGRSYGHYHVGINLATYGHGKGSYTLNTFNVMQNLGRCPAGDRILFNLANQ